MKFRDAVLIMYGELPKKVIEEEPNNPYGLETVYELCDQCAGEGHYEDSTDLCQDCKGNGYLEKGRE